MKLSITFLCEDRASFHCLGEYGLSLWIETNHHRLLLDTGMGRTILRNADTLGMDFRTLDGIVLSHGHLDHTGGLGAVLEKSGPMRLYHHPAVFEKKITRRHGSDRDIGFPFDETALSGRHARLTPVREPLFLNDDIVIAPAIPMVNDFEHIDEGLYVMGTTGAAPDPFDDELAVGVCTDKGLIVVLGCAHRGAINTITHLMSITHQDRLRAVVGGTHLMHADASRIDRTVAALTQLNPEVLACCHCTGPRGRAALAAAFAERFVHATAGHRLRFL